MYFDQGKAEKRKFVSLVEPPRGFGRADCISEVPTCAGSPDSMFPCGGKLIETGGNTG